MTYSISGKKNANEYLYLIAGDEKVAKLSTYYHKKLSRTKAVYSSASDQKFGERTLDDMETSHCIINWGFSINNIYFAGDITLIGAIQSNSRDLCRSTQA